MDRQRRPQDVERAEPDSAVSIPLQTTHIPDGSMTIQELCTWIRRADADIQNSLVTDFCWWAESETVLRHQFIILRWAYAGTVYDLILERAGKAILSPFRRATDKATVKRGLPEPDAEYSKGHRLLFALLTDRNIAPEGSFRFDAFVDFLDYKWAGPYPRLRDLSRYVEVISAEEPRYSLTSSNCYWFARMLFHTLALRHYAAPFVASSIPARNYVLPRKAGAFYEVEDDVWRRHDPSSVGLAFRFLHYEEWRHGILMFRRITMAAIFLLCCAASAGSGYGVYRGLLRVLLRLVPLAPNSHAAAAGFAAAFTICVIVPIVFLLAHVYLLRWIVALLTYFLIRRAPVRVLNIFDRDSDPDSLRGDCIPPTIDHSRKSIFRMKRKLPTPWQHDKKIYAPRKDEYLEALAAIVRAASELEQRGTISRPPERIEMG